MRFKQELEIKIKELKTIIVSQYFYFESVRSDCKQFLKTLPSSQPLYAFSLKKLNAEYSTRPMDEFELRRNKIWRISISLVLSVKSFQGKTIFIVLSFFRNYDNLDDLFSQNLTLLVRKVSCKKKIEIGRVSLNWPYLTFELMHFWKQFYTWNQA